jgi:opacity protein-like surface antigen
MKRNYCLALAACALLGSASADAAAAPAAGGSNQTELAFQAQPGVWVFRDATTGKTLKGAVALQHLQAIRAELSHWMNDSTEGLTVEEHADGSKSMNLEGRMLNVAILNIGTDGSPKLTCTQSVSAAVEALRLRTVPMRDGLETE